MILLILKFPTAACWNMNLTKSAIKNYNKDMNKNTILVFIFIAGIVMGVSGFYLFQAKNNLSLEKAGETAIGFINKALARENANVTASLMGMAEESGIYKIHLKIENQEYDSFISKDGKYLFSTAFDLEQAKAEEIAKEAAAQEENLEIMAKCLTDKGAKFYGASWCSWCKKEKELFGEAAQYLPYVECID